ncbi:right-handed parallel beta-helix repeat-containing protein [Candidatus Bathyarchaeota archaeon]|nr:right-handed parallel beta-helix repeat-containing protein [Candidatus Bathyarchaeota archaeon]
MSLCFLLVLLTSIAASFQIPIVASFQVIIVNPGESIQSAINVASENATIIIKPGKYVERLQVIKSLTLTGEVGKSNSTIIQNSAGGTTLEILRGINSVKVANLFINGSKTYLSTGIYVKSQFNLIQNVTVANHYYGIHVYDSSYNVMRNNCILNNTLDLRVFGLYLPHFLHDIDDSNLVSGRKVYYWINQSDKKFPTDAGYIAAVNCANVTVENVEISNQFAGVTFAYTNNSNVINITSALNEYGVYLLCSKGNTVSNSTLTQNFWDGILLITSTDSQLESNIVKFNDRGICFSYTPLIPAWSDNNVIRKNILANNREGVYLENSSRNQIVENTIANSTIGIDLVDQTQNCTVFHNNFLNNAENVGFFPAPPPLSAHSFDNGYPSGGNFWSNYVGQDIFKGKHQNETGIDGIGDTEHNVTTGIFDHYPLMHPYGSIRNLNTSLIYLTLQAAIAAPETLEKHIIFVKSGTYREPIVIQKPLIVCGENKDSTVIITGPSSHAVTVLASNVTLKGFTISNEGGLAYSYGLWLVGASYNILQNNIVTGKYVGIMLENRSSNNIIQNNQIIGNNQYGIFVKRYCDRNIIFNNSILANDWNGIELAYSEENIIEANMIANNGGYGFEIPIYGLASNNVIFHNNFVNNSWNNPSGRQAADFWTNRWNSDGEGNYWCDYSGADTDRDGIGNTPYFINGELDGELETLHIDQFPLMGKYSVFMFYGEQISVISNAEHIEPKYTVESHEGNLTLNVTAEVPVEGFLRIRVSRKLINTPYKILLDGQEISEPQARELPCSDEVFLCLYVSTSSGEHFVDVNGYSVIPEPLNQTILMFLFLSAAICLLVKALYRNKNCKLENLNTAGHRASDTKGLSDSFSKSCLERRSTNVLL